jgi:hypothetical protein
VLIKPKEAIKPEKKKKFQYTVKIIIEKLWREELLIAT